MVWRVIFEKNFEDESAWGELTNMKYRCPDAKGVGVYDDKTAENTIVAKWGGAIALPSRALTRVTVQLVGCIPANSKGVAGYGFKFIRGSEEVTFRDEQGNTHTSIFFVWIINNTSSSRVSFPAKNIIYIDENLNIRVEDENGNVIARYKLDAIPERIMLGAWADLQTGSGSVVTAITYVKAEYTNQYLQMLDMFNNMMRMMMSFMPFMMFIPLIGSLFSSIASKKKEEGSK